MQIEFVAHTAETDADGRSLDRDALRDFACAAEEAGFGGLAVAGLPSGQDVAAVASFVLHSTATLGVLLRHRVGAVPPTIAAQHLATLDQLSGGRVTVAFEPDRLAPGETQEDSLDRVDEYLVLLKRLWANERPFDHEGAFYSMVGAFSAAKPFGRPRIPLSLGGLTGSAIKVAARHADIFELPDADALETGRLVERVRAAAAGHRRADEIRFSCRLGLEPGGDASAERLALAVLALHDLGVVEFRVSGLANAPALAAFGQAVIPLVRRTVSHHASHARQPDAGNARLSALRTGI